MRKQKTQGRVVKRSNFSRLSATAPLLLSLPQYPLLSPTQPPRCQSAHCPNPAARGSLHPAPFPNDTFHHYTWFVGAKGATSEFGVCAMTRSGCVMSQKMTACAGTCGALIWIELSRHATRQIDHLEAGAISNVAAGGVTFALNLHNLAPS